MSSQATQQEPVILRPHPGPQTWFLASRAFMILYGGSAGGGKMVSVDEPVPTPCGWTTQGELRPGDLVFDEGGHHTRVIQVHPVNPTPEAYRITLKDGATIEVDGDHLWLTFTSIERSLTHPVGTVRQTREIAATLAEAHAIPTAKGPAPAADPWRYIVAVEPTEPTPMRCITVENPRGLYQVGRTHIVTHNSWVLIYAAILHAVRTPGWTGLICRNKQKDLDQPDGLWTTAQELGRLTGGHCRSSSPRDITWPSGGRLVFDYLADGNYRNYRGAQIAYLGIDEANECSIEAIIFLMSRLRTTCGAEPVVRMTCNPDPDHELAKWVDPHYLIDGGPDDGCPDRSQSGRIRYWARRAKDDQFCFGDTREEAAREAERKEWEVNTFTFIDALLDDNPSLAGDEDKRRAYLAKLSAQGAVVEDQLVRGDWRTRPDFDGMLRLEYWGGVDGRMVEPISPIVKRVRAWDLAGTQPKPGAKNPDWTAGVLMGWDAFGRWYIEDVVLCRLGTGGVDDLLAKTASEDGPGVTQVLEQDPAVAGKRDVKTTRAVLKSGGNCGPVVVVVANKKKQVKARPMSNDLRLGMVGSRPREHALDKGPRAPRGFFLNASGWMDRRYEDLGVGVTTVGKIVLHQIRRFFDPQDKIKDDVPDAAAIAHNHGSAKKPKGRDVGDRWDRLNS